MERALKERIVGAVVLVTVVVLVVPVFLDGPDAPAEVTSEPVLLPGQDKQDVKTVVLDRERTVPIPNASDAAAEPEPSTANEVPDDVHDDAPADKPVSQPQPDAVTRPPPEPAAASSGDDSREPATGMWAVQLGSFANRDNAEKLAAGLRKQDYAAFLSRLEAAGGVRHRVRVGPLPSRESAEAMAARLKDFGHEGQVVPHP